MMQSIINFFNHSYSLMFFFFFFQAEDGIRDVAVTGVQTCALPISPLMLVSNCSSKRLSGVSASGANFATPAFTYKTSILPSFFETSEYNLSTSESLDTSAWTARTPLLTVFTASSSVFLFRPEMATRAPSSCRRFAVASPMPLFPPVTTATFPCNLLVLLILSSVALSALLERLQGEEAVVTRRNSGIWLAHAKRDP